MTTTTTERCANSEECVVFARLGEPAKLSRYNGGDICSACEERRLEVEVPPTVRRGESSRAHPRSDWDDLVDAWRSGAGEELRGQLRQAWAAANVERRFGKGSIETFARKVGSSKSRVYDLARAWRTFEELFTNPRTLALRLESGLTFSHFVEASYAPEPRKMLERAERERLSVRQIKALRYASGTTTTKRTRVEASPTHQRAGVALRAVPTQRRVMERHAVEVSFVGEELASHTEGETTSRLYRSQDETLYVYWQDGDGAWLETGAPGRGVSPAIVARLWPELAAALEEG